MIRILATFEHSETGFWCQTAKDLTENETEMLIKWHSKEIKKLTAGEVETEPKNAKQVMEGYTKMNLDKEEKTLEEKFNEHFEDLNSKKDNYYQS